MYGQERNRIRRSHRCTSFWQLTPGGRGFQGSNLNQLSPFSNSNRKTKFCRLFYGKNRESCKQRNSESRQRSPSSLKFVKATSMNELMLSSNWQPRRKQTVGMASPKVTGLPIYSQTGTHSLPSATVSWIKLIVIYRRVSIARRCLLSSITSYPVNPLSWRFARTRRLRGKVISHNKLNRRLKTQTGLICIQGCLFYKRWCLRDR
jgi:hypothetical protein